MSSPRYSRLDFRLLLTPILSTGIFSNMNVSSLAAKHQIVINIIIKYIRIQDFYLCKCVCVYIYIYILIPGFGTRTDSVSFTNFSVYVLTLSVLRPNSSKCGSSSVRSAFPSFSSVNYFRENKSNSK